MTGLLIVSQCEPNRADRPANRRATVRKGERLQAFINPKQLPGLNRAGSWESHKREAPQSAATNRRALTCRQREDYSKSCCLRT